MEGSYIIYTFSLSEYVLNLGHGEGERPWFWGKRRVFLPAWQWPALMSTRPVSSKTKKGHVPLNQYDFGDGEKRNQDDIRQEEILGRVASGNEII